MSELKRYRILILIIAFLLIAVGIIMVYDATAIKAYEHYGNSLYFLIRYGLFLTIGLIASLLILSFDKKFLQRYSKPVMFIALFLLGLVLMPKVGTEAGGARRWLSYGILNFQPSEFAKLALVLYLASYLSRKGFEIKNFMYGLLPVLMVTFLTVVLILLEPDLGSGVLIFLVAAFMIFVGGMKLLHLVLLGLLSIPAIFYLIVTKPYRMRRIVAFLNPWQHKSDAGYQLVQSLIALGSGRVIGVGLGCGEQKLYYLPAAHTDFIFSIIGEELGFIGTLSIVILYVLFAYFGLKLAFKMHDVFSKLVILGIVILISLQALIHIGSTTGLIPTKGLPLPFVSYGGSSLFFNMIAVAILLNVSRVKKQG